MSHNLIKNFTAKARNKDTRKIIKTQAKALKLNCIECKNYTNF